MTLIRYTTNAEEMRLVRESLLNDQAWECAICRTDDPGPGNGWHLDHCHRTGWVRGVLCQRCNIALGFTNDSVEFLLRAITYLEHSEWLISRHEVLNEQEAA